MTRRPGAIERSTSLDIAREGVLLEDILLEDIVAIKHFMNLTLHRVLHEKLYPNMV